MTEKMDELARRIVRTYPQPIAFAVGRLEDEREHGEGFHLALTAFEESARYLALVGIAHYLHRKRAEIIEPHSELEIEAGRLVAKPSFGGWHKLLRRVETGLHDSRPLVFDPGLSQKLDLPAGRALLNAWWKKNRRKINLDDLLRAVVEIRNAKAHPTSNLPQRKLTPLLRGALLEWLEAFRFLAEYRPLYLKSNKRVSPTTRQLHLRYLVGTGRQLIERVPCALDVDPWEGGVWLWNGEGELVEFSPLAHAADDGEVLCTFVQVSKGKIDFCAAGPRDVSDDGTRLLDRIREVAPFLLEARGAQPPPGPSEAEASVPVDPGWTERLGSLMDPGLFVKGRRLVETLAAGMGMDGEGGQESWASLHLADGTALPVGGAGVVLTWAAKEERLVPQAEASWGEDSLLEIRVIEGRVVLRGRVVDPEVRLHVNRVPPLLRMVDTNPLDVAIHGHGSLRVELHEEALSKAVQVENPFEWLRRVFDGLKGCFPGDSIPDARWKGASRGFVRGADRGDVVVLLDTSYRERGLAGACLTRTQLFLADGKLIGGSSGSGDLVEIEALESIWDGGHNHLKISAFGVEVYCDTEACSPTEDAVVEAIVSAAALLGAPGIHYGECARSHW